ncbi:MAG TPA: AMP-binding protein, partial [Pseudonocardia sp.]
MSSRPSHIHELLSRWAEERSDDTALQFGERSWTWAQLAERVAKAVAAQRAAGLEPGARIAVLDLNHPSCLETTLACAQAGTANVVVNFRLTPAEIEYVINDSDAELLLVGPEFADAVTALADRLPKVRRIIRVGDPDDSADEYESWLDLPPDYQVHPADPDDCFMQLYTSGTTGFPKGAMLTHRGMLAHCAHVAGLVEASAGSTLLVAMPLFHVGGSSYALAGLYAGARMVMTRTPDPALLLRLLESERVTHSFFVPALL